MLATTNAENVAASQKIKKQEGTQLRVPLGNLTNTQSTNGSKSIQKPIQATDKKAAPSEVKTNMSWLVSNDSERIVELEIALRDVLSENKRIHELCAVLTRENTILKEASRQLQVVSMLYDVAKMELDELHNQNVRE